jgi:hypothetical protein
MTTRSMLVIVVALLGAQACDGGPDERPTEADTLATPVVDTAADSLAVVTGPEIVFDRSRTYDFDGDGSGEVITVQGRGTAWDSMRVELRIAKSDGTTLWADTFGTTRFTGLDPDPAMSRDQINEQVRSELDRILSDEAFSSTQENFDDANIDLRSRAAWLTDDEFARFQDDLMARPMFRYYEGGESSVGIT